MAHIIAAVESGSISAQLGIGPGDELTSINGERLVDWIDYQALSASERMELIVKRGEETLEFSFMKDEYEPLGLQFETPLMSGLRECANRCVFCFVDQLPKDTRASMHVKDDDWRTSLMMGSFVTLTNVGEKELGRIIRRHATPLYISVHATDDQLRSYLLGTERGAGIMKQLRTLADGGIQFHAQAVLCPGLNDGAALEQTIEDLVSLHPAALSLALVPVGLTGHRDGLCPIQPYDWHSANEALDIAKKWRKRLKKQIGSRFVHAADELYLLAGRKFPSDEAYEDYPQIDNGVGLCRMLETEFHNAFGDAELSKARPARLAVACGTSVAPFMARLIQDHSIPGVEVSVHPLQNDFFGHSVTVSGLLTGGDLIRQMAGVQADKVLITECMLRDSEDVFLDNISRRDAERALGLPIIPVGRTGEALLNALCGAEVI